MAFVPEDATAEPQPQGQAPGAMNQPATSSTGAGSPQGAASVPNAGKAPPVQDLKAYLEANAPQSVQMGQNIAGNLNQQAGQVTGDINKAGQDFGQTIQDNSVTPNPDLVSKAAADPASFVQDPNNVAQFQKQANANYTGPESYESTPDYTAINQEVANTSAPDITKAGGISELVRGQEKNPTAGMTNLDTLLLQGNPGAVAPIKAALPQFGTLKDALASSASSSNAAIAKAVSDTNAAKKGVQDTFFTGPNAAIPTFENTVNKEFQDALSKSKSDSLAQSNSVKDYLEGVTPNSWGAAQNPNAINAQNIDDKTLADLGLTRDQYLNLINERDFVNQKEQGNKDFSPVDLTSFLGLNQKAPEAFDRNSFASPEEYAKAKALEQLTGDTELSSFLSDPSKAGTANLNQNLSSIDASKMKALEDLYNNPPLPSYPPSQPGDLLRGITDPGGIGIDPGIIKDITNVTDPVGKIGDSIMKPIEGVGNSIGNLVGDVGNTVGVNPGDIPNIIADPMIYQGGQAIDAAKNLTPSINQVAPSTGDVGKAIQDITGGAVDSVNKSIFGGNTNLTDPQRQTNEISDMNKYIASLSPADQQAYAKAHNLVIVNGQIVGTGFHAVTNPKTGYTLA